MKKYLLLLLGGLFLVLNMVFAQPTGTLPSMQPPEGYIRVKSTNSLPRFDLDFPGGTPRDLAKAVEKAIDRPLNVVIPDDLTDLKIPAFSVKNVTVAQLFEVLKQVSKKTERFMVDRPDNNWYFEERTTTYGFSTPDVPDANSIWYFYREGGEPTGEYQTISTKVCHFYQLSPYLAAGYKVEDITTAIETAWKMLGVTTIPQISYHKDTKVLIAVGQANHIRVIDNVLQQLSTTPKGNSSDKNLSKSNDK